MPTLHSPSGTALFAVESVVGRASSRGMRWTTRLVLLGCLTQVGLLSNDILPSHILPGGLTACALAQSASPAELGAETPSAEREETPQPGLQEVGPPVGNAFEVELRADAPEPVFPLAPAGMAASHPGDLPVGETVDVQIDQTRMATVERSRSGEYRIRLVTQTEGQADEVEELTADGTTDFQDRFPEVARAVRREQLRKFLMNRAAGNARLNGMRTIMRREGARITIDVQQGQEHILMTQVDGQVIKVRRQWTEQGEAREEEFEAVDLPALRKANPRIAEIFEKQTAPNPPVPAEAPAGKVAGGLGNPARKLPPKNFPINRLQLNGPIFIGGNPIGGIGGVVPGLAVSDTPTGPRTIRARYRGARLQIQDVNGASIRISLIPDDPAEPLRAAEAADLSELVQKSPLLAELYSRYTGTVLPAAGE